MYECCLGTPHSLLMYREEQVEVRVDKVAIILGALRGPGGLRLWPN